MIWTIVTFIVHKADKTPLTREVLTLRETMLPGLKALDLGQFMQH